MQGDSAGWSDTVLGEYLAEGAVAPIFMVRRGQYKYIACETDPPQLYDLSADPRELANLAGTPGHAEPEKSLAKIVATRWDSAALSERVIASQKRRRLVFEALTTGARTPWDYRPPRDASRDYIRNNAGLYDTERRARIP
jgi:choline-sulfatase